MLISQRALCVVIETAVTINTFQGSISQIKQHALDVRILRSDILECMNCYCDFNYHAQRMGDLPHMEGGFSRKFNKCFHWWRHLPNVFYHNYARTLMCLYEWPTRKKPVNLCKRSNVLSLLSLFISISHESYSLINSIKPKNLKIAKPLF